MDECSGCVPLTEFNSMFDPDTGADGSGIGALYRRQGNVNGSAHGQRAAGALAPLGSQMK